ncbi:MAG: alpha/beta hydrolase [Caulobacteraceae bacterium]|nr:alpha/beta hydrolase [Caulobacteraceae bacterium]
MNLVRTLRAAAAGCLLALPLLAAALPAPAAAAPAASVQTLDRGRFTVEVSGEGPDVILIPGLISSRAVYDAITPALARHYRVHRVQVAGFAGLPAGPNAEGPMLQPFVDALAAYIRERHLDRPALIGHSMGGFSGLLLAQQHPELVGRVMVVDAAPFISAIGNPAATVASSRGPADQFRAVILSWTDEQFAAAQPQNAAFFVKTPAARPQLVDWAVHSDRRVMAQATWDVMTTDARPGLAAMTTPVTVLYAYDAGMSQQGREVTPQMVDQMYAGVYAGLPGVTLVRIDGSYHFIMLDQPDRFRAEVETFLR